MADGFSMEIRGLKELDAKLENMKQQTAARAVWHALEAGGEVFQQAVQELAPERPDLPSGTALPPGVLKIDIELHRTRDEQGHPAVAVRPGKYTAHVARWVEYGHRMVRGGWSKITGGKVTGPGRHLKNDQGEEVNVPAHPFIRPAYESARETAVMVAVLTLENDVRDLARK